MWRVGRGALMTGLEKAFEISYIAVSIKILLEITRL